MAGSMKEIKLRIRSVESTMQITKAMELVASSKLRRAKARVEGSRPYFETLYSTLYDIVSADSGFDSPYLVKRDTNRRLYIVIAGTSDNATIAVPAGIVFVTVGEETVKVVVK